MSYYSQGLNNQEKKEKINKLYNTYKKKFKEPIKKYDLSEIDCVLKTKYLAKEIVDDTYLGLIEDEMVNIQDIVKMYKIDNPQILHNLLTKEEKEEQKQLNNIYYPEVVNNNINIILESKDGKYVSAYTLQNAPLKINALMLVMISDMKKEYCDINDNWFQEYLLALEWAGYIVDY